MVVDVVVAVTAVVEAMAAEVTAMVEEEDMAAATVVTRAGNPIRVLLNLIPPSQRLMTAFGRIHCILIEYHDVYVVEYLFIEPGAIIAPLISSHRKCDYFLI